MENLNRLREESFKRLAKLKKSFNRIAIGNELQMIEPLLETLTLIKGAKALPKEVSFFFLSQCFLHIGIDSETSILGFVGPSINKLIDNLSEALSEKTIFSPPLKESSAFLLKKSIKTTVLFAIGAGKLLNLKIKKNDTQESPLEKKEREKKRIYKELVLIILASSEILNRTFKGFVRASGGDKKTESLIAEILSFISLILIAFAAHEKKEDLINVISLLRAYLEKFLQKIEELMNVNDYSIGNETKIGLKASVNYALSCLKNENYEGFIEAIYSGFEVIGTTKAQLEKDILLIENMMTSLYKNLTSESKEFSKMQTEVSTLA